MAVQHAHDLFSSIIFLSLHWNPISTRIFSLLDIFHYMMVKSWELHQMVFFLSWKGLPLIYQEPTKSMHSASALSAHTSPIKLSFDHISSFARHAPAHGVLPQVRQIDCHGQYFASRVNGAELSLPPPRDLKFVYSKNQMHYVRMSCGEWTHYQLARTVGHRWD